MALLFHLALVSQITSSCSNASFKAGTPGRNSSTSTGGGGGGGGGDLDTNLPPPEGSDYSRPDSSLPCIGVTKLNLPNVTKASPNIVPNGDFESGYQGFTSDYRFNDLSSCSGPDSLTPTIGEFGILMNPNRCHRAWDEITDSNQIAVYNGAVGQNFWCKTFSVNPNQDFVFSVDERLLHPDGGVNSTNGSSPLRWTIDGVEIIPPSSPERNWRTRGAVWNSGSASSIEVCGRNGSPNNSGNDWAIDNICLVPQ